MRLKSLENKQGDGNPTFVIGDPMKKVHMGKNKSLVSSANTKIDFYQFSLSPFLWCGKC